MRSPIEVKIILSKSILTIWWDFAQPRTYGSNLGLMNTNAFVKKKTRLGYIFKGKRIFSVIIWIIIRE
jgi:hypothetical protein